MKPILNLGAVVVGCYCFTYRVTGPSAFSRFAHICLLLFVFAIPLFGQSNIGELRLKVADPDGLGVKTTVPYRQRGKSIEITWRPGSRVV